MAERSTEGGSDRPHDARVDPAALLVAVLAVGVGPLTQDGYWSITNTMVAVTVLVVVVLYGWPTKHQRPTARQMAATSWVIAFLVGQALAWPIQELVFSWGSRTGEGDDLSAAVSAVVLGWALTWPVFRLMSRRRTN